MFELQGHLALEDHPYHKFSTVQAGELPRCCHSIRRKKIHTPHLTMFSLLRKRQKLPISKELKGHILFHFLERLGVSTKWFSASCKKLVDLQKFGTKLPVISAFALDHVRGFVFVEAKKASDVTKAALFNQTEIALILMDNRANVESKNGQGCTI